MVVGLAAVGGLGYAMTLSGGFVVRITRATVHVVKPAKKKLIVVTKTIPVTKVIAADDQYGTTTTTTTTTTQSTTTTTPSSGGGGGGGGGGGTTTTPTQSTTTTGSTSTTVPAGASAQVTVVPGGQTSVAVSGSSAGAPAVTVNVPSSVFSTPVHLSVNPAPGASSFGAVTTTPAVSAILGAPPLSLTFVSISASTVSGGASVTSLAAPLEVDFSNVAPDWQPFYVGSDGFHWIPDIGGPSALSCGTGDGFYRSGSTVVILTCHLTVFGAASPSVVPVSESGKATPAAGSGSFGDPTRNHFGPPVFTKAAALKPANGIVPVTFRLDEQAEVDVSIAGASLEATGSKTTRGSVESRGTAKTLKLLILQPGTVSARVDALGLKPGGTYTITLTATDYDGHTVTQTAKVTTAAAKPKPHAKPKKSTSPAPPAKNAGNRWGPFKASVAAKLPSGSTGAVATSANGKVFVVAGREVLAGSSVGGLHRIATLPASLASAQLIVGAGGTSLYVVGGEHGGKPVNRMYVIELATGAVRSIGKFVEPLAEGQVVQATSAAYIVGGWTGTKYGTAVLLFNSPTDIEVAARLPIGLRAAAVTQLNGTIYVAGGEKRGGGLSTAVYAVDAANHKVKKIGSLPVGSAHGTLLARGGKLYLVGGSEVIRIDPATGATATVGSANPLASGSGFSLGGNLFVADGSSGAVYRLR